jgi:hypothetical protein
MLLGGHGGVTACPVLGRREWGRRIIAALTMPLWQQGAGAPQIHCVNCAPWPSVMVHLAGVAIAMCDGTQCLHAATAAVGGGSKGGLEVLVWWSD